MSSQRLPERSPSIAAAFEYHAMRVDLSYRSCKALARFNKNRVARSLPNRKVLPTIADIIKRSAAHKLLDRFLFPLPGEIHHAVTRQHVVKQVEMVRNSSGDRGVCTSRQNYFLAAGFFPAQEVHQFCSIRQMRGVERRAVRDFVLQRRLTAQTPERNDEYVPKVLSNQRQQGLPEGVDDQNRSIQIGARS